MKLTKRIAKLTTELAGRMSPKNRRWLVARLVRLEALRKAKYGK